MISVYFIDCIFLYCLKRGINKLNTNILQQFYYNVKTVHIYTPPSWLCIVLGHVRLCVLDS